MLIHGVRYESKKFQRSFEAWRFQPAGRPWASWFDADGREVPGRLTDGPIATWEQITSFIGDGRGHSGMDFKAPVGTPVTSPFDGSVVRVNWNWKFNGNCVEVKLDDGRVARYLHLSGVSPGIQAGGRVKKGQEIGKSGNTGRSNAPHLHYELSQSNGRVLDPLRVHQVEHPLLSGSDADRFKAERERLLGLVSAGGATAASAPALGAGAAPAPAAAAAAVPAGR
jgi:murein DD-endopeptidase MepM/ murein hydrolase activator NlpD